MHAGRAKCSEDSLKHFMKPGTWNVKEARVSPDCVISLARVQLLETHDPHWTTNALLRFPSNFRGAVRRIDHESKLDHRLCVHTTSAAKFQDLGARFKKPKEA
jgi:hypothetical protein